MQTDVSEIVAVLERTPAVLRALLEGLTEPWLEATEGEGTFGPLDIVGHLIHGERTDWVPRMRMILTSGETQSFVPFGRSGFREAIRGRSLLALLTEFQSLRRSNLDVLRGLALAPEQLALKGRHPASGTARQWVLGRRTSES